jgi:hypothetical protein
MSDTIEDWSCFFSSFDEPPMFTFIKADGSLKAGEKFDADQVAEVLYQCERNGDWDWDAQALVSLKDGNFAYLTAWQETTFNDATHFIAESLEALFKYAMTEEEEKTVREHLQKSH